MNKLITFCIPCYNSAVYINKCVSSILSAGEDIEIILVNDGSFSDNTAEIIDDYVNKYPRLIKAIHKVNGGHGSAVNSGLLNASGKYFKVVDSDDWLNEEALQKVMDKLRNTDFNVDMLITNYVYEHQLTNTQKVMGYSNVLQEEKIFTWNDIKHFRVSQYLLMHSVIYKTELLRRIDLKLPEHTFYVDNIYVYTPLPYVESMFYMNIDLYRYYIGRNDQSVNENVMMSRVDQQIKVSKILIETYSSEQLIKMNKKLFNYMSNYLSIMVSITSILLLKIGDENANSKRNEYIKYLYQHDLNLYRIIRYQRISAFALFKTSFGKKLSLLIYRIAQELFKFN